ncbi:MAG TPA: 2-amino-4-hydroxy-6-hydroxymethyldihydropteridine diphosphokinase, partial [bacterium (Candidatus Stahlbacteria)]|nr:2-amino-4-hydroxy-6-hydroxymethyldihydropteridine diphosphokinase [Candidatus Stahlbacteria bacterium]
MGIAYIGIGSNIGDRLFYIKSAINAIAANCEIINVSSIYETEPIGYALQPNFLNCVISLKTSLTPQALLHFLLSIENKLERKRKTRFGPRTIDLDILLYDNLIIHENDLIIPHPEMHKRQFVLLPLNEIAPNLKHPILHKSVEVLLKEILSQDLDDENHKECN